MTGVWQCWWLLLRTSWASVLGWPVALAALLWSAALSILDMYPDDGLRGAYAAKVTGSVAVRVFQGRGYDLTMPGGILAQEMAIVTLTLFPLVGVHLSIRLTRSLEDGNYLDVITAGRVGRIAPVVAGMLAAWLSALLTGALTIAILTASGYAAEGSIWYATSLSLLMAWASAVGLLAGQLFRNGREAHYVAIAVVLGCYLLRGYLDVNSIDAVWSNPISWLAETRPFSDSPQWWPYLSYLIGTSLLAAAALWFATRRDLGGGVFSPRPGPRTASPTLRSPVTLIWRLTRGSGVAFLVGGGVTAFVFGLFAREMASSGLEDRLVLLMQVNALFSAAVATQAARIVMVEENAGRSGRVLSEPVGRSRWMTAAALVIAGWSVAMLLWTGLLSGAGLAISLEDIAHLGDAVLDTLAYTPAVMLVGSLACALGSIHPTFSALTWLVVIWSTVVSLRADLLQLGDTTRRLSPLEWMGKVPAEDWARSAALSMSLIAVALFLLSLSLFRRRDLIAG